jgi:hypothetical protein
VLIGNFLGKYLYEFGAIISINAIWLYSKFCVYCENRGNEIYQQNESVQNIVDAITNTYNYIGDFLSNAKKEPNNAYWITLCTVQNYDRYEHNYVESLQVYDKPICSSDEDVFNESLDFIDKDILRNSITVMKTDGLYKIRIFKTDDDVVNVTSDETESLNDRPCVLEPSCVKILNAVYKHPEVEEPIELNVSQEMFMVGNQLFSPAFVRRCLEYQNKYFVFDTRYTVEIVDSNVNVLTLRHGNYLQIEQNTYRVV